MKRLLLALVLASLCGCAHQYVMKLNSGQVIYTPHKPKLQGGFYHYKDLQGRDNAVAQSRVAEIATASQAKEEAKEEQKAFKSNYPKPKTHWWQFWR